MNRNGLQTPDPARVFFTRADVDPASRAGRRLSLENAMVQHRTQKPSKARLTQLTANIEPTIAAADANVAMVFTDRMTKPLIVNAPTLFDNPRPIMARFPLDK